MHINRFLKMFQIKPEEGRIEKWVLRRAFDDEKLPYLPNVYRLFPISFMFIDRSKLSG